jgi:PAS domain-containing protein
LVTTLLNNTEDVMFVVNRSGQIVAANVQAAASYCCKTAMLRSKDV